MQEIKLPQLGQTVEEATITQWLKKEGDTVAVGDVLFTVQTDKAEIECESTAAGVLRKILVPEGVEKPVLSVVAWVGGADETLPELPKDHATNGTDGTDGTKKELPPSPTPAPVASSPSQPTPLSAR